ncbi:mitochondrial protein import protein ZIM17 [Primulina huaijiensis]|uniref:mitochondrial protein import protein ZIM17 n=1 Tax=Primulina huaijiensis TaxID=1492673 RepID=UPI003CC726A7
MAARRILSLLAASYHKNPKTAELFQDFHPASSSFYHSYGKYTRACQTLAEATNVAESRLETCSSEPDSGEVTCVSNPTNNKTDIKHVIKSKLKISERHDRVMIFTCKVCNTRSIKTTCRESYDKGVVVARCDGCNSLHLIADRLGWFGEPGSVEEFLAARGEEVKKGSADTLNLTLEDLVGKKSLDS